MTFCERTLIVFPSSRTRQGIYVERSWDCPGWLVLTHDRAHGLIFGDFASALREAREIASGLGTVAISSAGVAP
jgi:hypothetical protein